MAYVKASPACMQLNVHSLLDLLFFTFEVQKSVCVQSQRSNYIMLHRRRNQGGRGGRRATPTPQYFTLKTSLIFIHAAQITAITVYITFGPPKMELLPTPMYQQSLPSLVHKLFQCFNHLQMVWHGTG